VNIETNSKRGSATLLDRPQLAQRWLVSIPTLKRWENDRGLRRVKLGPKAVRYRLEDVLAFEAEHLI
jgi:predicted DNA-binding transcriptional regulator AlpA